MNNPNHPQHRKQKDALAGTIGEEFLTNFYLGAMLWKDEWDRPASEIGFRTMEEYPIVKELNELTIDGKLKFGTKRIDFIYLADFGHSAIFHNNCVSIGIEIKSNYMDMQNLRQQLKQYKNHTDYFFVAVPDYLVKEAKFHLDWLSWVGIFSYNTGQIYKYPVKIRVSHKNRVAMLFREIFSPWQEVKHTIKVDYDDIGSRESSNI